MFLLCKDTKLRVRLLTELDFFGVSLVSLEQATVLTTRGINALKEFILVTGKYGLNVLDNKQTECSCMEE